MNNVVFWKRMWENVRKYRDTKLVIAEETVWCQKQTIILQSFYGKFLSNRTEKRTQTLMNKSVYLGHSIVGLSKILIFEFWCDSVQPK